MIDLFDRAQELEQKTRDMAIAHVVNRPNETPDEDADGNRFCLRCGEQISAERLNAAPNAVRCVPCQSVQERAGVHYGV